MTRERMEAFCFISLVCQLYGIGFDAYADGSFNMNEFRRHPIAWAFALAHTRTGLN